MSILDHWHPVYPSRKLKKKPVEVKLAGRMFCLFRTESGIAAAVDNVCPHRRLKLSYGRVVGERIECKYHGWKFTACGDGESAGTPKLTTCTESFEVREEHGYLWLKSRESNPAFPKLNENNYYPLGTFFHLAPAPLELAVDNFNEIEHSGTVHDNFGYDLDRMHEVEVTFEPTETSVRVINTGPTKRLFKPFAWSLGIRQGDIFHDDWITYFSPVYSVFDHWWTSPDGAREAALRWRVYVFFSPVDDNTTALTSFAYAKSRLPVGPAGGLRVLKYLIRRELDREVRQDIAMLENLAVKSVDLDGMKLSRFDRILGLTRERIARIYRGEAPKRSASA